MPLQIKIPMKYAKQFAGAVWTAAGPAGRAYFLLEVGRVAVCKCPIPDDLKQKLENHSTLELLFDCGTKAIHAKG
jgi:hypothetical protein